VPNVTGERPHLFCVERRYESVDDGYRSSNPKRRLDKGGFFVSILWIILIVVLVLVLLGFFSRGAW